MTRTARSTIITAAAAADDAVTAQVTGDTNPRFVINADGKIEWGPGNAALDVNLYRSAADTLTTEDSLRVLSPAVGAVPLAVKGFASQTADLQQWQDSAGTVLTSIGAAGLVLVPNGSNAAPSVSFFSDPDTGIFRSAANRIGFSLGGTETLTFGDTAGYGAGTIRIGTTNDTFIYPIVSGSGNGVGIDTNLYVIGRLRGGNGSVSSPSHSFTSDPDTGIYSTGADSLGFTSGGTLRLTLSTTSLTSTVPVILAEMAAPSTPAAGHAVIYPKTDGRFYSKDDAGTETALGVTASNTGTVVHGATAGTARPATFGVVLWVGTVRPSNAVANDLWNHTGYDMMFRRGASSSVWTLIGGGPVGGPNLETDPSFERNDLTGMGWNQFFTGTSAASSAQARTGTYSLLVTRDTGGTENLVTFKNNNTTDNIAVVPGEVVTASAWARPATTARSFSVQIQFIAARTDGFLSPVETWDSDEMPEVSGQWINAHTTGICPAGAGFARIVYKWASVPDSEAHYLDDISIQRGAVSAPEIVAVTGAQTIGGAKRLTSRLSAESGIDFDQADPATGIIDLDGSSRLDLNAYYGTVIRGNLGSILLRVKGAASQTASLQEWQDSNEATLTRVAADGSVYTPLVGMAERTAPATPSAGTAIMYPKSDGLFYSKDDAGVETLMSSGTGGSPDELKSWALA